MDRAGLLAELDAIAGRAVEHGRVVVVVGEAGIGKTTVLGELACTRPERVLWGACEPLATARPLLPVHDWARSAGAERLAEALADAGSRHDVFQRVLDELDVPTLAVVEDLHWADDATLDLLVFLGRRIADRPATLVVSLRTYEPETGPRVHRVIGHLLSLPGSTLLDVPPLTREEIAGLTSGTALDPVHVEELTRGNAFFVSQLVGAPTAGVPGTVREAVLARVDLLSDGAREVVRTVAVVPDRATLELVHGATSATSDDVEEAEHGGLLVSESSTIAFRHEIAREVVEQAMSGPMRRDRHAAVLAHLLAAGVADEASIAYHADAAGAHEQAVVHGRRAARRSSRAGAHRQAIVQLQRARGHLGAIDRRTAAETLLELAVEHQPAGPMDVAVAVARDAVDAARQLEDADLLAHALAVLGRSLWLAGDAVEAREHLAEAVEVAERAPGSSGQLVALVQAARSLMLMRRLSDAIDVGGRAAALATRLGDDVRRGEALNSVATSMLMSGDPDGMPMVDEGLEIAVRAGDDGNASLLLCNAGSSLGELRHYAEAVEMLERCVDFCRDRDLDLSRDYATSWLARVHLERGSWPLAEATARSLAESPSQLGRLGATTVLGRLEVRRGGTSDLLHQAWAQASSLDEMQRRWPVAAGLAESAILAGTPLPEVVAATFDAAVGTPMPWAIGELGWHLVDAGLLAADDGRLAGSAAPYAAMQRGAWIEAAELWDDLGCPYDAAVARARSDRPAAVTQALRTFDELGARPDGDRAAARLRALGVPVPRRPRQAGMRHGLTTREAEVMVLLQEGLTDREIAERLFISVKTAGHHVSSILSKVGVASRREVAR